MLILNCFKIYWDLFSNFQSDFQTQCSRLTHKDDGTLNSQRVEFCGFYFTATYTFVLMEKIAEYLNEVCMLVLLCIIFYFSWVKSARICFVLNCCLQRWFYSWTFWFVKYLAVKKKICVKVGKLNIIHPVMLASFSPAPWWSSIIKWWPKSWETMQCSRKYIVQKISICHSNLKLLLKVQLPPRSRHMWERIIVN